MKKKGILMLSCIAAIAIATFVGKKTFESHAYEAHNLLIQNVEALTDASESEPYPEERKACIEKGGIWNMASVCNGFWF